MRIFAEDIVPLCNLHLITARQHAAAFSALLSAGHRRLSLVDCASFETMRYLGLTTAFAFDRHFTEQGFTCLPA